MYWNTVTPLLRSALEKAMADPAFKDFRLVGGTSLSLQLGHRISVDIDLFTDANYGAVNFEAIHKYFTSCYNNVSTNVIETIGLGTSYYVGNDESELIKIDVYYTDKFIRPVVKSDGIRLASKEDIIAMKLDIICRGGRKKDFWDLHALHDEFDIQAMINFYHERYPYGHSSEDIFAGLSNFFVAEDDFDPVCLKGKHWELIKLDFENWVRP